MRFSGDPCIVSIRAFLLENDTAYIVMEYVDGPTLKQAVRDAGGKMPSRRVLTMLKPIMSSLYSVHRAGLIHRDISPDNILLRGDGSAVLIDVVWPSAGHEVSAVMILGVLITFGAAALAGWAARPRRRTRVVAAR